MSFLLVHIRVGLWPYLNVMRTVAYVFIFNGNDGQINNRPLANLLDLSSYRTDSWWAWHGSRHPAIVPTST